MERFSQLYLERGTPTKDSERMRRRLFKLFEDLFPYDSWHKISGLIHSKNGVKVKIIGPSGYYYPFEDFFDDCQLRDLLDMPSILALYIKNTNIGESQSRRLATLINNTNYIFREENVHYQVDDNGVVHFSPDEEFEKNRISAFRSLEHPRYEAVLNHFNHANKSLLEQKYDYAIRDIFYAAESLVKLMTGCDTLSEKVCRGQIKDIATRAFGNNESAKQMVIQVTEGYAHQIKGYHQFRHAQPTDNNSSPELAILAVSNFSTLIRFLVDIDQVINAKDKKTKAA